MTIENSLIRLEEELAFQERKVEALNEALTAQQKQIDTLEAALKKQNARIEEVLDALHGSGKDGPVNEKPPHYL
ncbi:SlyX family protein [Desulfovibrio sp. OttesenSCG-928-F07]|nr:SlyX family protein [Desulfovibrio sp. OttesenSCG-928-F07]